MLAPFVFRLISEHAPKYEGLDPSNFEAQKPSNYWTALEDKMKVLVG